MVKNSNSHKEAFLFVFFLLMQVKDFLDSVLPVGLLQDIFAFFVGQIILNEIDLLQRSEPQIGLLSELWMRLIDDIRSSLPSIEISSLSFDVLFINIRNIGIRSLESLHHRLGEVGRRSTKMVRFSDTIC